MGNVLGDLPMKELVEFIARELVHHPEQVVVSSRRTGTNLHLAIHAATDDVGRLIGRQGRTAEAIRILARVAGARKGLKVTVDIE